MKIAAGLILGLGLILSGWTAPAKMPYIQLKSGEVLEVNVLRLLDAEGDLEFEDKDGKFILSRRFYDYAVTAFPDDVVAADKLFESKQTVKAIDSFTELAKKYRYLGWEYYCLYKRMQGLIELNRDREALDAGETLRDGENVASQEQHYFWLCRNLMIDIYLKQGKSDKALMLLREQQQCQDWDIAAGAYNRQGDILLEQQHVDEALLQYMRPVVMFDREVAGREYSLRQVVKLFKERKDKRGELFATMLDKEYPESKSQKK